MGCVIDRLWELVEIRKQRELTLEEKKELRLFGRQFKRALSGEPDQPLAVENEISRAERQAIRRRFEQQPDSPAKMRELRVLDLATINAYERKLTAEEKAKGIELYMQEIEGRHSPALAALIGEAIEEPTDIK